VPEIAKANGKVNIAGKRTQSWWESAARDQEGWILPIYTYMRPRRGLLLGWEPGGLARVLRKRKNANDFSYFQAVAVTSGAGWNICGGGCLKLGSHCTSLASINICVPQCCTERKLIVFNLYNNVSPVQKYFRQWRFRILALHFS